MDIPLCVVLLGECMDTWHGLLTVSTVSGAAIRSIKTTCATLRGTIL